jgi:hypothetical protein
VSGSSCWGRWETSTPPRSLGIWRQLCRPRESSRVVRGFVWKRALSIDTQSGILLKILANKTTLAASRLVAQQVSAIQSILAYIYRLRLNSYFVLFFCTGIQ